MFSQLYGLICPTSYIMRTVDAEEDVCLEGPVLCEHKQYNYGKAPFASLH